LAYFDFFTGKKDNYKVAREIVSKYTDYPINSWKMLFLAIVDQLNEYDGEFDNTDEMAEATGEVKAKKFGKRMKSDITDVKMNDLTGELTIESVNVKTVTVKYYTINAELLFSRAPFLKNTTEGFSYVRPMKVLEEELVESNSVERKCIVVPESL